eukprot:CAMPEP_0197854782 /NCGR_PEP_ID=MMETSP1438-20131217/25324_1 /TAXON_ID=1461541 /ORGANISM="Pterosperma sp., Strain CCMP1384" /LENGTH=181 /DNA_ID=CAMNT_0043469643 /DNA_START=268 /DNA_END=813 /DNA_ORIENTATION=-
MSANPYDPYDTEYKCQYDAIRHLYPYYEFYSPEAYDQYMKEQAAHLQHHEQHRSLRSHTNRSHTEPRKRRDHRGEKAKQRSSESQQHSHHRRSNERVVYRSTQPVHSRHAYRQGEFDDYHPWYNDRTTSVRDLDRDIVHVIVNGEVVSDGNWSLKKKVRDLVGHYEHRPSPRSRRIGVAFK